MTSAGPRCCQPLGGKLHRFAFTSPRGFFTLCPWSVFQDGRLSSVDSASINETWKRSQIMPTQSTRGAINRPPAQEQTLTTKTAKRPRLTALDRSSKIQASPAENPLPRQEDAPHQLVSCICNHACRCNEMPPQKNQTRCPSPL
jgi:hypothetical protein